MRIITPSRLKNYAKSHPSAKAALEAWQKIVKGARWKKSADIQKTINSVDIYVTETLKRTLFIFNLCGNEYRLICAIHFERTNNEGETVEGRVYVREFLTHPQYDKGQWKVQNDKT